MESNVTMGGKSNQAMKLNTLAWNVDMKFVSKFMHLIKWQWLVQSEFITDDYCTWSGYPLYWAFSVHNTEWKILSQEPNEFAVRKWEASRRRMVKNNSVVVAGFTQLTHFIPSFLTFFSLLPTFIPSFILYISWILFTKKPPLELSRWRRKFLRWKMKRIQIRLR